MRKVVLYIATSLDGYIAGEEGDIDWLFTDHDTDYGYYDFYSTIDTIIMGRKSYEGILRVGEFPYKEKKCYVFSKSLSYTGCENVEVVNDLNSGLFLKDLVETEGDDIWLLGGGRLISSFMKYDLIDRIIISIHPLIIGGGVPLFERCNVPSEWSLDNVESFASGLVQISYNKK